jgi:hypothetical protein
LLGFVGGLVGGLVVYAAFHGHHAISRYGGLLASIVFALILAYFGRGGRKF